MTEPRPAVPLPVEFTVDDHRHMARAVVLARRGVGLTDPNPSVGCVLVRDGIVVGEGTTAEAGGPHAEIVALAAAGDRARGATAYVTLEPCAHFGRTGPCTRALIAAGIERVVAAALDPDARMNGNGLGELAAAGIRTECGCQARSARAVNPGYWSRFERGRPWLRLKLAASLDGRTALASGESQWITSAESRADVHRWRARSSAVLTGSGTVLADDPALTARPADAFPFVQPVRIVVDSSLRTPPTAKLFDDGGRIFVFHAGAAVAARDPATVAGSAATDDPGAAADAARQDGIARRAAALEARGAQVEAIGDAADVDLPALLDRLGELAVNTVWVEAGATLAGALLEARLVDQLVVYLAPDLLGGSARGMAELGPLTALADRIGFEFDDVRRIGRDLRILATPASVHPR